MLTGTSLTAQILIGTSLSGVMETVFYFNKDCLLNSAPNGFSRNTSCEQVPFSEEQRENFGSVLAEARFLHCI